MRGLDVKSEGCVRRNDWMSLALMLVLWSCTQTSNAGQTLDTSVISDVADTGTTGHEVGEDTTVESPDSAVPDTTPMDAAPSMDVAPMVDSFTPPPQELLPTW